MTTGKLPVLGSVNIDHIFDVKHFPCSGETVTGGRHRASFGGKGSNQAVAAACCGAGASLLSPASAAAFV